MQILQWLFKVTHQESKDTTSSPRSKKETNDDDHKAKTTGIILVNPHHGSYQSWKKLEEAHLCCGSFKPFTLLYRKDIPKACFYSTLNLRRLGIRNYHQYPRWVHPMKMKKEEIARGVGISHRADAAGNKVLPITEASLSSSNHKCDTPEKKEGIRGDRSKPVSKMKELLRWAAATKSQKGGKFIGRKVLKFRNRRVPKGTPEEDNVSNESPKISFRWEVENSSTISSSISMPPSSLKNDRQTEAATALSLNATPLHQRDQAPKRGNWITTDSEFVVLEL